MKQKKPLGELEFSINGFVSTIKLNLDTRTNIPARYATR
jgi:hypothetical protein